jgi:DNA-binding CsgD family transcriptional regulator
MTPGDIFGIDPAVAAMLVSRLTPAEYNVCAMTVKGYGYKVIARRFRRTEAMVCIHSARIAKKLGCPKSGWGRLWYAAKFAGTSGDAQE